MHTSISPIKNVAGVAKNITATSSEPTKLVVQVCEKQSSKYKTLLTDCFGYDFNNFLTIEHQTEGLKSSFNVNGFDIPLENNKRSLKKFHELANLFQVIRKREQPFPLDKDYLKGPHCAVNLDYDISKTLNDVDMLEIENAHKLEKVQSIADNMTYHITKLTSKFFGADFTEVVKGLDRNKLWIK